MSDLKILIVDDSLFFREALARGLASNISGTIGVEKAENPTKKRESAVGFPSFLVEPLVGFEPTTPRLQITCSGQLS